MWGGGRSGKGLHPIRATCKHEVFAAGGGEVRGRDVEIWKDG